VEAQVNALVIAVLGLAFLVLGICCQYRIDRDSVLERAARRRVLRELARREEEQ
jgi:hypothetical protein